jgi:hypothetical protein
MDSLRTLVRAARELATNETQQELLDLIAQEVEALAGRPTQRRNIAPRLSADEITFPVPIFLRSVKLKRQVEGTIHEDGTVEAEGKQWPGPSNKALMNAVLGYDSNGWNVWHFTLPDGTTPVVNRLRHLLKRAKA